MAFERASLFGRPVFFVLTVNWNRAAQRLSDDTLADPELLRAINRGYVSVKVNADLRPDIRERYQTGAWPMVAFLLPNGKPMLSQAQDLSVARPITTTAVDAEKMLFLVNEGRVYWDKWSRLLLDVGDYWVGREAENRPTQGPADLETSDLVARWLLANADRAGGGFGAVPKFVVPAVDEYAALRQARGRGELREHTQTTLELLVASALYDPIEGGVHRLASAPSFRGIHYEKMLGGNAALVRELTFSLREAHSPELRAALSSTAGFIVNVLGRAEGGLWLAQLADSTSPDGGGYWRAEPGQRGDPPPVDRIVLAGANALAGAALLRAGLLLEDEELARSGRAVVAFVHEQAYHPGRGVIHSIEPIGDPSIYLRAQADAALGFVDAYETTGEAMFLEAAKRIVEFVQANLSDPRLGAMRDHLQDPLSIGQLINPRWPVRANARLARTMLRLSWHGLGEEFRERAMEILATYCGELPAFGVHGTEPALAIEEGTAEPLRITISGPPQAAETRALRRAAVNSPWAWTLVLTGDRSANRPSAQLLWRGKQRKVGRADELHRAIDKLTAKPVGAPS
jgi:uncharacterized protein YyaL (SSP411 family)